MKIGKMKLSEERTERRKAVLKQMEHKDMILKLQLNTVPSMTINQWCEYRANLLQEATKTAMSNINKGRLMEEVERIDNWIEISKRVTL